MTTKRIPKRKVSAKQFVAMLAEMMLESEIRKRGLYVKGAWVPDEVLADLILVARSISEVSK